MLNKNFSACGVLLLATLLSPVSLAQEPDISSEFIGPSRFLEANTLRFCSYKNSPLLEQELELARKIADIMLLDYTVFEVEPAINVQGIDFIPISLDDLFIHLSNNCHAFLGIELVSDVYPEWLITSIPYAEEPYVLTVTSAIQSVSELGAEAVFSTQGQTTGDFALLNYINNAAQGAKWRRIPYPNSLRQLEKILDHTTDAALVWKPWIDIFNNDDIKIIDHRPIVLPDRKIGFGLLSSEKYLRTVLDDAIRELEITQ